MILKKVENLSLSWPKPTKMSYIFTKNIFHNVSRTELFVLKIGPLIPLRLGVWRFWVRIERIKLKKTYFPQYLYETEN